MQAYLNGIDVPGLFQLNTLVVKLAGSVGAVAGGLAVGKEGPFVHAGACLGALLSQVCVARNCVPCCRAHCLLVCVRVRECAHPLLCAATDCCHCVRCQQGGTATRHLPWFKRFWNDRDRADLVACGAAAGALRFSMRCTRVARVLRFPR